jgi:hypothetical protein
MNPLLPVSLDPLDFMSKLIAEPLDFTGDEHASTTLLIVPPAAGAPLELHIDSCQRRCVALYDSQRIVQFAR